MFALTVNSKLFGLKVRTVSEEPSLSYGQWITPPTLTADILYGHWTVKCSIFEIQNAWVLLMGFGQKIKP